jgi:hypothetical protein
VVVTGLSAAILLARRGSLSEVVGRSWVAAGFHSLPLRSVTLVSFLVGGRAARTYWERQAGAERSCSGREAHSPLVRLWWKR